MANKMHFLDLDEAARKASDLGLPVVDHLPSATDDEAVRAAVEIGYPVVLKVLSPLAVHKSQLGGVKLSLAGEDDVRRAYQEIEATFKSSHRAEAFRGVTVSPMLPPGLETIVGLTRDEELGPAIMFGLGGVAVEVYGDVSFRLPPLSRQEARRMIEEIKAYPLLAGYRGSPPSDVEALIDCLLALSALPESDPAIVELELNPLILYPDGCQGADVRMAIADDR